MVPGLSRGPFFMSFFFYYVFIVKVQELACIVRYGVKKTLIPTTARFTSSREKSNTSNPYENSPSPSS